LRSCKNFYELTRVIISFLSIKFNHGLQAGLKNKRDLEGEIREPFYYPVCPCAIKYSHIKTY